MTSQKSKLTTAADLLAPGVPEKFTELIAGELIVGHPAGREHNRAGTELMFIFREFCRERSHLNYCGDNYGFYFLRNPDFVLSPDAAMFRDRPDTNPNWFEFAPEITVEILSPSNSQAEMAYKRQRFFDAGTEQFWLVDPEQRTLTIYHRDARIVTYQDDATIVGEGIATGLQFPLPELFQDR